MKKTLFFQDRPLFGIDIGRSNVRIIELTSQKKKRAPMRVNGYGAATFDPTAIEGGVIVKPEVIAEAVLHLFKNDLVGTITTRRVAFSLPVSRMFTRIMQVPKGLSRSDIEGAVQMEAEQYIPVPASELYIDFSPARTKATAQDEQDELLIVAAPKKIVDSYLAVAKLLDVEPVLFETSMSAIVRLFGQDTQKDVPAILIDFGSESADITIYDQELVVSGTVPCGGETFTRLIADALSVTPREAETIKAKYGLNNSKRQKDIERALIPTLDTLIKEISRTIRYQEDRGGKDHTIGQIVMIGGGAGMPGLSDYLTNTLRMPVRTLDPTAYLAFGKLQPISIAAHTSYVTIAGLGMVHPSEVFA